MQQLVKLDQGNVNTTTGLIADYYQLVKKSGEVKLTKPKKIKT